MLWVFLNRTLDELQDEGSGDDNAKNCFCLFLGEHLECPVQKREGGRGGGRGREREREKEREREREREKKKKKKKKKKRAIKQHCMLLGSHDLLIWEKSPLGNASRPAAHHDFFCSVVRGLDR